jgi:hypothetical protein
MFKAILGGLGAYGLPWRRPALAAPEPVVPSTLPVETVDFEKTGLDGWTSVEGEWAVETMLGAPSGSKVLVQRAVKNEFNVILTPLGPYSDLDVSMKFKPISGKEDASGGIVFRFSRGRYYVVRANALEDNVRLYIYDRARRQIATRSVKAPTLGQWHGLRVVAVDDRMQAWLDGQLVLEHRDARLKAGRVGLWTKADSVTAFDDLTIRGVKTGESP